MFGNVCYHLKQFSSTMFTDGRISPFIVVEKGLFISSFSVFTGALTQCRYGRYGDLPVLIEYGSQWISSPMLGYNTHGVDASCLTD